MMKALDDAVGELVDAIKEKQMLENTIIIFTTDVKL